MNADEPTVRQAHIMIDGRHAHMDVIKFEGKFWLVPEWLVNSAEGWRAPERIILLDSIEHDVLPDQFPTQFLVNHPVPKGAFFDHDQSDIEGEYIVVLRPDIRLPTPDRMN